MQYTIHSSSLQPSALEIEQIDARVSLTLSRFTNLIEKCEIHFSRTDELLETKGVQCEIKVRLTNTTEVVIHDVSENLPDAFFNALNRIKRNIERQLKHGRGRRVGGVFVSRTLD